MNSKKVARPCGKCECSFRNSGKLAGYGAYNPSAQEVKQEI